MNSQKEHLGSDCVTPESLAEIAWISVYERLPEVGTDCLVWTRPRWSKHPYAMVDRWDEQHECPVEWSTATVPIGPGWDGSEFDDVTHWMPLPPPPRDQPSDPLRSNVKKDVSAVDQTKGGGP